MWKLTDIKEKHFIVGASIDVEDIYILFNSRTGEQKEVRESLYRKMQKNGLIK